MTQRAVPLISGVAPKAAVCASGIDEIGTRLARHRDRVAIDRGHRGYRGNKFFNRAEDH